MKGTTDFLRALDEIERDKGVSKEIIFDSLEKALLKSYEKKLIEEGTKLIVGIVKLAEGHWLVRSLLVLL